MFIRLVSLLALSLLVAGCLEKEVFLPLGDVEKPDTTYVFKFQTEINKRVWAIKLSPATPFPQSMAGKIVIKLRNKGEKYIRATSPEATGDYLEVGEHRIAFDGPIIDLNVTLAEMEKAPFHIDVSLKIEGALDQKYFPIRAYMYYQPPPF